MCPRPPLASLGWELLQALISVIAMLFCKVARHQAIFWVLKNANKFDIQQYSFVEEFVFVSHFKK